MQKSIFRRNNSKKFVYYNENMNPKSNFKRDYLENYNDSKHAVKRKNAPFFINFPNINKNRQLFPPLNWSFNCSTFLATHQIDYNRWFRVPKFDWCPRCDEWCESLHKWGQTRSWGPGNYSINREEYRRFIDCEFLNKVRFRRQWEKSPGAMAKSKVPTSDLAS